MNIVMLGSDTTIFDEHSQARARMLAYAHGTENFTIIISSHTDFAPTHEKNIHIYAAAGRSRLGRLIQLYIVARRELKKINSPRTTVITAQDPFEHGLVGALIARATSTPLEIQVHTDIASTYFKQESLLNRLRVFVSRWVLSRATKIRVVSKSLQRAIKHSATVLPIWVDTEEAQTATPVMLREIFPGHGPFIYMASRLTSEKQLLCGARAVLKLQKEFPKILLIVSGEGPLKSQLEKFSVVRLTGFVPNIAAYMKGADIFLLNSLYEGYGRTLRIAAATHTPIVSTRVGIAPEIIRENENGFFVESITDENALVDALRRALTKKDAWKFPEIIHTKFEESVAAQHALWASCLQ